MVNTPAVTIKHSKTGHTTLALKINHENAKYNHYNYKYNHEVKLTYEVSKLL